MSFFSFIPPAARAQLVEAVLPHVARAAANAWHDFNRPEAPAPAEAQLIDEDAPRQAGSPYRRAMAPLAEAVLNVNNYLERELEHAAHTKRCDCDDVLLRYEAATTGDLTRALRTLTTTEVAASNLGSDAINRLNRLVVSPPATMPEQGREISKLISQLRRLAELDEARQRHR